MAEREKQYKGIISYEKLWNLMQFLLLLLVDLATTQT